MHDELELVLSLEHRAGRLLLLEVEADRREVARAALEAEMPASPHLDVECHRVTAGVNIAQLGRALVLLLVPIPSELLEVRLEPER
ncbi:MAG: hypothetical protein ACE5PT_11105 [Gemmatimonadales bacterium]